MGNGSRLVCSGCSERGEAGSGHSSKGTVTDQPCHLVGEWSRSTRASQLPLWIWFTLLCAHFYFYFVNQSTEYWGPEKWTNVSQATQWGWSRAKSRILYIWILVHILTTLQSGLSWCDLCSLQCWKTKFKGWWFSIIKELEVYCG